MLTCLKKAIPFWTFILFIQQIQSWKIYYLQKCRHLFSRHLWLFCNIRRKTLKMGIMTRAGAIVMLMSWLYPSCTYFQRAVYFVLDIAFKYNANQRKRYIKIILSLLEVYRHFYSKPQTNLKLCAKFSQTENVRDIQQRSRSRVPTRGQGCS